MKYILVTGAFGGMGRAFIERAEDAGYSIFALDVKIPEGYREDNIVPIKCDITSPDSINNAYEKVSSVTRELFAIVHFAGIYTLDSLIEIDPDRYERMFRINVFGPYYINRTFFPLLKEDSRIVITTSELAPLKQLPFTGLYGITKTSLDSYAFSLSMELQLKGIKVSVLRPGAVKTNMLGASTTALENFTRSTKVYKTNAPRFRMIVDSVETKAIEPEKIAEKVMNILSKKNPRFAYSINRNFLLKLTRLSPARIEKYIVMKILQ